MHSRSLLCAVALVLSLTLLAAGSAVASETPGDTFAVSVNGAGEFADAGTGDAVSISADGRFVTFVSAASNLADEAPAGVAEVYVKDLDSGAVVLASRAAGTGGAPALPEPIGEQPAGQIEGALISGDGRYVVFASKAHNLVPGLPLAAEVGEEAFFNHVYRRDLLSGETELVDRVSGAGGEPVPFEARAAAISADGRFVLFRAPVEDLDDPAGAHAEGLETLYLRDMVDGTTAAVGRASNAGGEAGALADAGNFDGAISGDGRYVLFSSPAANLDPEANGLFQVYRRDLQTGTTTLVSRAMPSEASPEGEVSDGESFEPTFVGSGGCRVAFVAVEAANLFGGGKAPTVATYLRDLCAAAPTTTLLSRDEDGQPFEEGTLEGASGSGVLLKAATAGGTGHLYLRDPAGATTALLDRAAGVAGAPGDHDVELGAISASGCRAAFTSGAENLTAKAPPAGGSRQQLQVYVRQLAPCELLEHHGPGPGIQAPPARAPFSIALALATARRLWLDFDAAASAGVRIQHALGHGRWRLVRALRATARGPETVRLRYRALPRGVYRALITPDVPGAQRLSVRFSVGIEGG